MAVRFDSKNKTENLKKIKISLRFVKSDDIFLLLHQLSSRMLLFKKVLELKEGLFLILPISTFRAKSLELAQLPKVWLKEVLCEVRKTDSDLDFCATRRSAGLPHYIKVNKTRPSPKLIRDP